MQKEAQTVGAQKLKHRGEGFDLLCDVKVVMSRYRLG